MACESGRARPSTGCMSYISRGDAVHVAGVVDDHHVRQVRGARADVLHAHPDGD